MNQKRGTTDNEFVWIPVDTTLEYVRYNFGNNLGEYENYKDVVDEVRKDSIRKYKGFYVGRYETGVTGVARTIEKKNNIAEEAVIQKDKNVYNFITRRRSQK